MKRSGVYVGLFLAIMLSNPSFQPIMASDATTADNPFAVDSSTKAAVNDTVEKKDETKVAAEEPKAAAPQTKTETAKHTVKAGDNLWRIAQDLLGDGNRYRELIEANKDKYPSLVKNPDLIHAGWVLEMPVEKEAASQAGSDAKEEEKPVATTPAVEVKVEDKSATSAASVAKIPELSVQERVTKLQNAIDAANRALLAQKKRIADLNESTVRFLIDNKFMTEEEWMAMNPPSGCVYRLNKVGKLEVVNSNNIPLSNEDIAKLDKAGKADTKDAKAAEVKKPVVGANTTKEDAEAAMAKADAKAKQEAYDRQAAKAKADKAAAEAKKIADAKTAADKAADAKKLADEKAAEAKKIADAKAAADKAAADEKAASEKVAKAAETRYQKMLSEIGAPDLADNRKAYNSAIKNGSKLMSKGLFGGVTPFYKFVNTADYSDFDIPSLEKELRSSQKHYEEIVDKNKTSRVLGIFGDTIESAGKKVEQNKQRLAKAWTSLQEALKQASNKAAEVEAQLKDNRSKLAEAEKSLAGLDKYDSANSEKVQAFSKEVKKLKDEAADLTEKIDQYNDLKKTFKI